MLNCPRTKIDDAARRRLMLLRHAKAEKSAPGSPDRERALAARGRSDAARIGAYMSRHGLVPDRVAVSPAWRTRETWELLAAALPARLEVTFEDGLYNAEPEAILEIARQGAGERTALIVGHNPGLHELAHALVASGDVETRERLHENLPAGGLVVIDFAGEDWSKLHARSGRLDRFVSPRSLELATD